jgi:A/G-specific adenine glycosylase
VNASGTSTYFTRGQVTFIRHKLRGWWLTNRRRFDWRETRDPYRILIAELMLHRTRAAQVLPVYRRFIQLYPSFRKASAARPDQIETMLAPLGLRWRSTLVQELITVIRTRMHGKVPQSREELQSLPGVSNYIAGAVLCFSRNEPELLLDTNIVRVVGRLTGTPVTDGSRRSGRFRDLLRPLIPEESPREFYFALIDLGALLCKPKNPECRICPLNVGCNYWVDASAIIRDSTPMGDRLANPTY